MKISDLYVHFFPNINNSPHRVTRSPSPQASHSLVMILRLEYNLLAT
jgi:hypothetical protein